MDFRRKWLGRAELRMGNPESSQMVPSFWSPEASSQPQRILVFSEKGVLDRPKMLAYKSETDWFFSVVLNPECKHSVNH